jgi:hypothetical protein
MTTVSGTKPSIPLNATILRPQTIIVLITEAPANVLAMGPGPGGSPSHGSGVVAGARIADGVPGPLEGRVIAVSQADASNQAQIVTEYGVITVRGEGAALIPRDHPVSLVLKTDGATVTAQITVPPPRSQALDPSGPRDISARSGPSSNDGTKTPAAMPVARTKAPSRPLHVDGSNVQPRQAMAGIALTLTSAKTMTATLVRPQPWIETSQAAATGPGTAPPPAAPTRLAPGTRIPVSLVSVDPVPTEGGDPPPVAEPLTAKALVPALVTGRTANGEAMVRSGLGALVIDWPEAPPPGARLILEITGDPEPPEPAIQPPLPSAGDMVRSSSWPGLEGALRAQIGAVPSARERILTTLLPRPGPDLGRAMVLFLAALRRGDITDWLGHGHETALLRERLADDFAQLSHLYRDRSADGDWRVALIPVWTGETVEPIRLMARNRRQHQTKGADDDDRCCRFVVDVHLCRLGRVQIDGLAAAEGARLDLIVRSERLLDGPMRDEIRRLFAETGQRVGYSGTIAFQASPNGFLELTAEARRPGAGGIIV